jgi:hypothetical protein
MIEYKTLITHERAAATTLLTCSECSPTWYKRRKQEREKKFTECKRQREELCRLRRTGREEHSDGKEEENTSAGGREDGVGSDYKLAEDTLMDEEFPDHGDDDNTFVDEESLDYQRGNSLFVDEARQYWMLFICTTFLVFDFSLFFFVVVFLLT